MSNEHVTTFHKMVISKSFFVGKSLINLEQTKNIALFQGKKVPNRVYVPNQTLSVRFGHKYCDQRFSNSSCVEFKYQFPTYY